MYISIYLSAHKSIYISIHLHTYLSKNSRSLFERAKSTETRRNMINTQSVRSKKYSHIPIFFSSRLGGENISLSRSPPLSVSLSPSRSCSPSGSLPPSFSVVLSDSLPLSPTPSHLISVSVSVSVSRSLSLSLSSLFSSLTHKHPYSFRADWRSGGIFSRDIALCPCAHRAPPSAPAADECELD